MTCGIYAVVNKKNNKQYIGSAASIENRWRIHRSYLNRNLHHSPHLQAAWNKYGEGSFQLIILQECLRSELLDCEQIFLNKRPDYNVLLIAGSSRGWHHSDETKKKMSLDRAGNQWGLGYKFTDEQKVASRKSKVGRVFSEETRIKISKSNSGKKLSEETKQKIRETNLGHTHTEESKKKMSLAHIGRLPRKFSKEACEAISLGHVGIVHSEETKMKMSESAKKAWERRHAEAS